ncbi:hypothetical protein BH11MYX1_BH11MYX1_53930 [soil metagenome]
MTPRRGILIACAIALVALVIAWSLRFGTDDSYITYVYARELVRGNGLTWFGTHIEGYTNFLWALWSALGLALGRDPLVWAWGASLAALVATIVTTYRIAALRSTITAGLVAAAILATNFTFLAFGTSGLETMLQTALLAAAMFEVERLRRAAPTAGSLVRLSLFASFARCTRLYSAPIIAGLGTVTAHHLVRERASIWLWAAAIMPALVLVGGWFAWKLWFYGDILPNTFYVKAGTSSIPHGAWFTAEFLQAYMIGPVMLGLAILAVLRRRVASALPLAVCAVHIAYVIVVGGDFMEFRFFVPIMPATAIAFGEFATTPAQSDRVPRTTVRAAALVAVLAVFSLNHALTFEGVEDHSYDSIAVLGNFYHKVEGNDWTKLGASLHDRFAGTRATLACNGAGAIPYNADLMTVDQLGLNDAWVARYGSHAPPDYPRPGHQRYATYDYLVAQRVTFVIGSPMLVERGALARRSEMANVSHWLDAVLGGWTSPPAGVVEVVAAPVDAERELLMWYLTPDPEVTSRLAGWDRLRLHLH